MLQLQDFKEKKTEFLLYLDVERNVSNHTLRAYSNDIEQFIIFWHAINELEKLDFSFRQALDRYFIHLYNKNIEKSSIARKISCFQSFVRYLETLGIKITLKLTRPRLDKKLPIYLSVDEIFYLLDHIELEKLPTRKPYRDKAIFELLYATGIRCSELVAIKLKDIDFEQKIIRIKGKGRKERIVLFGQKAHTILQAYLQYERPVCSNTEEYLFLNSGQEQLSTRSVQRIIEMFRNFLKIKRSITPHKLRHSFATHLLNQGTDLRIVQELLGHKTLASTEKYTHVCLEQLSEIVDTLHPFNTMQKKSKDGS